MDVRLLKAVRCQIEICRRQADAAREHPLSGSNHATPHHLRLVHLMNVAWRLATEGYERPRDDASTRKSVFVVARRSKKTAAAIAHLSAILGAPLPCTVHGRKMPALVAFLDAREARASGLRFQPLRLIRALRSITRTLDETAEQKVTRLLFAYWNLRLVLRCRRPAFVICVSDLSPRRIAAACAANAAAIPVLFFQDDWHHDVVPPFEATAASVLNGTGLRSVRPSLRGGAIVASRSAAPAVGEVRRCQRPLKRIGIALNNVFNRHELLDLARKTAVLVPGAEIVVRQHPRARTRLGAYRETFAEAPAGQAIGDFAAACDVVLVGNSAVQIGLLLAGTAVVHVGKLDKMRFDTYGYVSAGVVYGMESFRAPDLDAINEFYAAADWPRRFRATLALEDIEASGVLPADALGRWMAAILNAGDAATASR